MEPQPTRFTLPRWAKFLMALVTIVLLVLSGVYLMGIAERGRWERYAATLREAGEPLTFKEIEARRADLPDGRNSALVMEAAFEAFPSNGDDPPPYVLIWGRRAPPDDLFGGIPRYAIDDSRAFFQQHRPLLDALRPMLDMPTGRVTVAYTKNPFEMLMPKLSDRRYASKLARLDAILRLVDGDTAGAVDAAILQLHIAGSLNEHPSLIGHLVELSSDRIGMHTVQDVLLAGEPSDADLVRLGDAISARRRANPMRWGMWSERAFSVESYDLLASGDLPLDQFVWGSTTPIPPSNFLPEFVVRKNQILAAELSTRLVDAGGDLVAMHKAAIQIDTEVGKLGSTYFLVKMMTPSLSRAVYLQIEHDTILSCTIAGIAAERYRLATGHWPASLDELVPAYLDQVPSDPLGEGQPIKLAATDQGIVIYSIGDPTVDDDGLALSEENEGDGPDLGFRLLDPEYRRVIITDEPRPEEGD